jgi:hypothetical protein
MHDAGSELQLNAEAYCKIAVNNTSRYKFFAMFAQFSRIKFSEGQSTEGEGGATPFLYCQLRGDFMSMAMHEIDMLNPIEL